MQIADAEKNFSTLINKVYSEGISIDLERDNQVIARLTPAHAPPSLTVGNLNDFLKRLPALGDDAEQFAEDLQAIRQGFPPEANPSEQSSVATVYGGAERG